MRQAGGIHRYGEVMLSIENSLGDLAFSWQVSQEQIPIFSKRPYIMQLKGASKLMDH